MDRFSKYIKDRRFLDWVADPEGENQLYWETYLANNPEEKETIFALKKILSSLKTKDTPGLDQEEKEELFSKILLTAENRRGSGKVKKLVPLLLKYAAAVLVLAFGLGYYLIGPFQDSNEFPIGDMPTVAIDSIKDTQLILNSGEQFLIDEDESTVKYTAAGNVVVNTNDTISNQSMSKAAQENLNQLIVPYGRRSKISLEDGTIVHLNAGSRFVFPQTF